MQEFQTVDILVNNAGVVYLRDALTITKEEFDKTFSVNTTGTFLCSQFFAKVLKEKGSGGMCRVAHQMQAKSASQANAITTPQRLLSLTLAFTGDDSLRLGLT
jgi:NAD(P)-dependent dehydrogenase (short-subunit alcohol dehydrogenase family)